MTNLNSLIKYRFFVLLVVLGAACESGGTSDAAEVGCTDIESVAVTPTEETSLGFRAEDVFALVSGTHVATMTWGTEIPPGVNVTPAAGESEIEIIVTPKEKSARVITRSPASNGNDLSMPEGGLTCDDELQFEADVQVTTKNGAFADTFTAAFRAASASLARTSIPLVPGKLKGSFTAQVESPKGAELEQITLEIALAPGSVSGSVAGMVTTDDGEVASSMPVNFAKFPIGGCELGALIGSDSEFATEVTSALDGLDAFTLTWEGKEPTGLTLENTVDRLCFVSDGSGRDEVVLHVTSAAVSEDGRIDGLWKLEGHLALAPSGEFEEMTLLRQAYLADTYSAAEFEEKTGIKGVVLPPTSRGSFAFTATDALDGSAPQGTMTIFEIIPADCTSPPPTGSEDGTSSPGCAGDTANEIETGTLSAPMN